MVLSRRIIYALAVLALACASQVSAHIRGPKPCRTMTTQGNIARDQLKTIKNVADDAACWKLCTEYHGCIASRYRRSNSDCYLHDIKTFKSTAQQVYVTTCKEAGPAPAACKTTTTQGNIARDQLKTIKSVADDAACWKLCTEYAGCIASRFRRSNRDCYLHDIKTFKSTAQKVYVTTCQ